MLLEPEATLEEVLGRDSRFLKRFYRLGLRSVRDLLWHFPFRYEDFSRIYKIADLEPGQQATIQGVIDNVESRRSWRRRMSVVEAIIKDDSGEIRAVWFNQPYLIHSLRPGKLVNFSGKIASSEGEIYLSHPAYEILTTQTNADATQINADNYRRSSASKSTYISETRHTGRLVPIYPETRGLTSRGIRFIIQPILKKLSSVPEWLPPEILKDNRLPEINAALRQIHFPQNIEEAERAKQRFAFEDLFLIQLFNLEQKLKLAQEKSVPIKTDINEFKNTLAGLPFELTTSQKKSLWEIIQDLAKTCPMNRLLQGDVGSGKTAVAALAALITAQNGYQTAFMAPTEILAHQHFETLKKLFVGVSPAIQPTIALLTSSIAKVLYENDLESEIKKQDLLKKIEGGEIKIIIGTHALIQKTVAFKELALVIVDEQHRFGVKQRAALLHNSKNSSEDLIYPSRSLIPHLLSMSATPIPRTLMLTIFGDLNISLITELPKGRKNIITKIILPEKRNEAYKFIREQIKTGRQTFVICPRIEPTQTDADRTRNNAEFSPRSSTFVPHSSALLWEVKSVKEEYEKLSQKIFPDLKIAMLHGRLKAKEKERVMADFSARKIDVLVSTSVVEVGVDVPNATIMMIEGADRFGLAQLYQFRGRVGRGEHQSYCFLLADSSVESVKRRLKAVIEAKNGLELAERDLKIRGPGEFLGETQTGFNDTTTQALSDIELVKLSREAATKILQSSPSLKKYPLIKTKLENFRQQIHPE